VTDIWDEEKRSEVMSRIRSRDTKPEMKVKEALEESELNFEYQKEVLGHKVDFFIPPRTVILVNGCFWHTHEPCYSEPKSNVEYWRGKAINNRKRDSAQLIELLREGYRVKPVWECEVEDKLGEIVNFHRSSRTRRLDLSWEELGEFVGFVMGDGSLSYREYGGRRMYLVHLYNESKEVLDHYANLVRWEGLSVVEKFDGEREGKFGECWTYQVSSRFLYLCTYLTKLHRKLLAFPKIDTPAFNRGLVKGFFEAEGNWNNGQLRFYQDRRENLAQLAELLDSLGIESRIYPMETVGKFYLSVLRDEHIERFTELWNPDEIPRMVS